VEESCFGEANMSTKRNVRLRREYLYRKQLESNERVVYEKKRKLKQAIESGKPIPTELREEEAELRHQIEMDDANTEGAASNTMDDEYIRAGEVDPRVMITTSRNPSSRLVQFSKEMTHIFPNAQVCTGVFVQLYLYM
jgi:U3 small nucleolar ribonucleoprotein protein IMP4